MSLLKVVLMQTASSRGEDQVPAAPAYFDLEGDIWMPEPAGYFNRTDT